MIVPHYIQNFKHNYSLKVISKSKSMLISMQYINSFHIFYIPQTVDKEWVCNSTVHQLFLVSRKT
jgi:hypothetical protein